MEATIVSCMPCSTFSYTSDTEPDIESMIEYLKYIYPNQPVYIIMAFYGGNHA